MEERVGGMVHCWSREGQKASPSLSVKGWGRHTAADHPLDSPTPLCSGPDQSSLAHSAVASVINSIPEAGLRTRQQCVQEKDNTWKVFKRRQFLLELRVEIT